MEAAFGLALRRDLPRAVLVRRLLYRAKTSLFSLPPYGWRLGNRGGTAPATPPDTWPGDPNNGLALSEGRFTFQGRCLVDPRPLWRALGADEAWLAELNSFEWLRDLKALGGDQARRAARERVSSWLQEEAAWSPLVWHPVVLSRRLIAWLGHFEFFAATAEPELQQQITIQIRRQARHLARLLPAGLMGYDLLLAAKALILVGAGLSEGAPWLKQGLALLSQELPLQILPDGGHAERCPERQLQLLCDLVDLRGALFSAGQEPPSQLTDALQQMAPLLRLWQAGDGGLALFNGGQPTGQTLVELALQRAGQLSKPLLSAPYSGFQRLQAGRTLVLVDAGRPPGPGYDERAHAGTLSFELSSGPERLIVNCGAAPGQAAWQDLVRTTAAHSTLTLADHNSSELRAGGGFGKRRASASCRRQEAEGDLWLDMAHDGYQTGFGATHQRRLFLERSGEDFRGEDGLTGGKAGTAFAIRFHLHPDVQASLAQGGGAALLRTPRGEGWRLRCKGAEVVLEPSVYLADGEVRRSAQVVLSGVTGGRETQVLWGLQRETKGRR